MLRVGDLDRSLAFYTDVLGMKLLRRQDYPELPALVAEARAALVQGLHLPSLLALAA